MRLPGIKKWGYEGLAPQTHSRDQEKPYQRGQPMCNQDHLLPQWINVPFSLCPKEP